MRMIRPLLSLALAAAVAAPTAAQRPDPRTRLDRLLAGRVAGEPVSCIDPNRVRRTEVVPGQAIVYRIGSRLYVNRPSMGLDRLDDDSIFTSRRPTALLCRSEPLQLLDRVTGIQRGFVTLGDFVPYERAGS